MNTYLTDYRNVGVLWCGANIYAKSLKEAELIAEKLSSELGIELVVIGKLVG